MVVLNTQQPVLFCISAQNDKWKYEKIYESSKVVMMEGFNSPFQKNKKRDISLDPSRLSLGSDLGKNCY